MVSQYNNRQGLIRSYLAQQQTAHLPAMRKALPLKKQVEKTAAYPMPEQKITSDLPHEQEEPEVTSHVKKRQNATRFIVMALALIAFIALYFTWRTIFSPQTNASDATRQSIELTPRSTETVPDALPSEESLHTAGSNTIQVYIVGAVRHPGVYKLAVGARVYELLQKAGGPLPNANLVALNLAARLSDGQEIYVTTTGEKPPTYLGGVPGVGTGEDSTELLDINTASEKEMREKLHISNQTAQTIINHRTQHGPFTSIEQLSQVVSKSIYDKVKRMIRV
jgi:competence protein ComEA